MIKLKTNKTKILMNILFYMCWHFLRCGFNDICTI